MTADTDIAIVGGGLSGTIAAIVLARAGARVTLIDRNEVAPPEFRVEKLGGEQLVKLERLGLLDVLAQNSTRFDRAINVQPSIESLPAARAISTASSSRAAASGSRPSAARTRPVQNITGTWCRVTARARSACRPASS